MAPDIPSVLLLDSLLHAARIEHGTFGLSTVLVVHEPNIQVDERT